MPLTLLIGNKGYSSWSLRAWLLLKQLGIDFDEILVPLYQPESKAKLLAFSPAGKVPALRADDILVWESLAIVEFIAARFPDLPVWPHDPAARALARSLSAEMHSGFTALRGEYPTNFRRSPRSIAAPSAAAAADIARIDAAWRDARARFGGQGPFLFGEFSAADAMFAPVVCRFSTYRLDVSPQAQDYMRAIEALPAYREWVESGRAEPWVLEKFEK
ncbi:glutathione S-transferase [Methylosinus sp. R-45379]|uniref:glutathione S-transferase family protein n=1 Tax=unclassified Methylosinus TaxID=2624500 RepID=UPI0004635847|nr:MULTISPECIES: glutathione S-transferase family protein [unclassified Methylosinus]OAI31412.1 glutathione S-transferase [Methylosinus sp. R-45379]TDX65229.1 glutathione S-transferase [Methylosinus sp. sav-2]